MAGGDEGPPAGADGVVAAEPADGGPVGPGPVAHGGRDGHIVGEVAVRGRVVQPVDGGGQVVLGLAYGVVEGEGGLQERGEPGKPGDGDLGAQHGDLAGDVAVGAGVAHEGGDVGEKGGGARVEPGEQLVGEGEFVVCTVRVGERGDQGDEGLGDGLFAPGVMLLGFRPRVLEGGDGAAGVAVGPPDVSQDAVVAACPAQGGDGGEGGGEVAADAGEAGRAAAGARGEPAVGVGDLAVAVQGGVGAAEVLVGIGPVEQGEFGRLAGQ